LTCSSELQGDVSSVNPGPTVSLTLRSLIAANASGSTAFVFSLDSETAPGEILVLVGDVPRSHLAGSDVVNS
jgi:hypothetical protein